MGKISELRNGTITQNSFQDSDLFPWGENLTIQILLLSI